MKKLRNAAVRPEELAQPLLFLTFYEHLQILGLTEYTHIPKQALDNVAGPGFEYYCIKLTQFGRLFLSACVLESSKVVESRCNQEASPKTASASAPADKIVLSADQCQ